MTRCGSIVCFSLALAACNTAPAVTATNASTSEVGAQVAAAQASSQFVSPGRWEGSMVINDMTIPGMPPQAAAKMRGATAQAHMFTSCLTPEEASKPRGRFFGNADKSCRYDHFTMGGGKIDAAMTCETRGMKRAMAMTGTYAPDSYTMTTTSTGSGPGPAGMSMKMTLTGKRTGACTGKEGSQ